MAYKKLKKAKTRTVYKTRVVYRTRREKQDNLTPLVGGMLIGGALVSMSQHNHED